VLVFDGGAKGTGRVARFKEWVKGSVPVILLFKSLGPDITQSGGAQSALPHPKSHRQLFKDFKWRRPTVCRG
jgi:hypothetical protein